MLTNHKWASFQYLEDASNILWSSFTEALTIILPESEYLRLGCLSFVDPPLNLPVVSPPLLWKCNTKSLKCSFKVYNIILSVLWCMHIPKHVMIPRESDNGDNGKFASRLLRRKNLKIRDRSNKSEQRCKAEHNLMSPQHHSHSTGMLFWSHESLEFFSFSAIYLF